MLLCAIRNRIWGMGVLVLLLGMGGCDSQKGNNINHRIFVVVPQNYEGLLTIRFGEPNAPPLLEGEKTTYATMDSEGNCTTSFTFENYKNNYFTIVCFDTLTKTFNVGPDSVGISCDYKYFSKNNNELKGRLKGQEIYIGCVYWKSNLPANDSLNKYIKLLEKGYVHHDVNRDDLFRE